MAFINTMGHITHLSTVSNKIQASGKLSLFLQPCGLNLILIYSITTCTCIKIPHLIIIFTCTNSQVYLVKNWLILEKKTTKSCLIECFPFISSWFFLKQRCDSLIWIKLNSLHLRMLCALFDWLWLSTGSVEEVENVNNNLLDMGSVSCTDGQTKQNQKQNSQLRFQNLISQTGHITHMRISSL